MKTKLPYIDADQLRAALTLLAANDDQRIVTKVVHIDSQYIEATNGHAIVRMKHHAEFNKNITIQFNEPIPDDAEFSEIKLLDDGLCVAVHYRQDQDKEFRPFCKSELVVIEYKYPDFDQFLNQPFAKGNTPILLSAYLALPYLLFGRTVVGMQQSLDNKGILFEFCSATNELFGDPKLFTLAIDVFVLELTEKLLELSKEGSK